MRNNRRVSQALRRKEGRLYRHGETRLKMTRSPALDAAHARLHGTCAWAGTNVGYPSSLA